MNRKPQLAKSKEKHPSLVKDDLRDCISSEEFRKLLLSDLEKKYKV